MTEGIFGIWKPKGFTSNDVVMEIKKFTGIKKVGHAGTLDPLAEGVLVVAVSRQNTKQIDVFKEKEKEYIAIIKFGQTSVTGDEEGEKTEVENKTIPSECDVKRALEQNIGVIKQTPPVFSAVKIGGKEAYKRARKGEKFDMSPRTVEIKKIEILEYKWPFLQVRVTTGPGVYIRSLAHDVGEMLGVGGYLFGLIRTRVGSFDESNSISLAEFVKIKD